MKKSTIGLILGAAILILFFRALCRGASGERDASNIRARRSSRRERRSLPML